MARKEFPATERQFSEWEYALRAKNYSANMFYVTQMHDPDFKAIQNTFCALIKRHESLRTTFAYSSGELNQMLHDAETFEFSVEQIDCSGRPDFNHELGLIYDAIRKARLDRTNGPLIRAVLIKIDPSQSRLVFIIDHIISDRMSMELLKKDFGIFYDSFVNRNVLQWQPLIFQMKDLALWEKEYNRSDAGQTNLLYWKEELSQDLQEFSFLQKTSDWTVKHQPVPGVHGGIFEFFLNNGLLEKVRSRYGSESIFILASLFQWLCSVSGQKKIVIAMPFSVRDDERLENVVGYLISAMYLRVDLSEVSTFRDLVGLVAHKYSEAIDHRHYSRRSLGVDIDQYCPALLNNVTQEKKLCEFDTTLLRHVFVDEAPYYPLLFGISKFMNGWVITCHYSQSLFLNASASRAFNGLNEIIARVVSSPDEEIQCN